MTWLIINTADNSLYGDGQPVAELPDPLPDDTRSVVAPLSYGFDMEWSPELDGFVPIAGPVLISAMAFKLLFTPTEHLAVMGAASSDPLIRYYLDLINTPGNGIDLSHPVVTTGVQHLIDVELITAERGAQILSGTAPA